MSAKKKCYFYLIFILGFANILKYQVRKINILFPSIMQRLNNLKMHNLFFYQLELYLAFFYISREIKYKINHFLNIFSFFLNIFRESIIVTTSKKNFFY